jgi:predicted dehydrogenase
MINSIAVVGVGSIGTRHLQSLLDSIDIYNIFVLDPNTSNIKKFIAGNSELISNSQSILTFSKNLSGIPTEIDLFISATRANDRNDSLINVLKQSKPKALILEKLLSTSLFELDSMYSISKEFETFVNLPRRYNAFYREVESRYKFADKIFIRISGNRIGLLSNAIHFIDLISWLFQCQVLEIKMDKVNKLIKSPNRIGTFESNGEIEIEFSKSISLLIIDNEHLDESVIFEMEIEGKQFFYNETTGSNSFNLNGNFIWTQPLQSKLTSKYARDLGEKNLKLPKISDIYDSHKKLLIKLHEILCSSECNVYTHKLDIS